MTAGARLRVFRKEKGLTLKQIGKELGYSYVYISKIERGKVEPSRAFLKRLSEVFGLSIDFVLYGDTFERGRLLFSDLKRQIEERNEEFKKRGVVPKASISDDELAIVKLLRALSLGDSLLILREMILKVEADPLVARSDYFVQNLKKVKALLEKEWWDSGFDFDALLWGIGLLERREKKPEALFEEIQRITARVPKDETVEKKFKATLKRHK